MERIKHLCFIFFFNILIADNNSTTIGITIIANTVSDVSVNTTSISTTIENIFELRDLANSHIEFSDVIVTYITNTPNQKLTLTSNDTDSNNFYLHHGSHTNAEPRRILLRITKDDTTAKITPNSALISNIDGALDSNLTLNIKFGISQHNAAHEGSYTSDLSITWASID